MSSHVDSDTSTQTAGATADWKVAPWASPADAVLQELDVSPDAGLAADKVAERRRHYGRNQIQEARVRSAWLILLDQFRSIIVLLLVAAMVISFLFQEYIDAVAILVVIVINAAIGFGMELRARTSMHALRKLGRVMATVRREGEVRQVPADELVPGDILVLEGGDVVTADARLLEVSRLQVDESMLTGESVVVSKQLEPVAEDAVLADRVNMLYKGTGVTRGSGQAVVVATGMQTEMGAVSDLVAHAEDETTPLEERLDRLGRRLVWVTVAVAALTGVSGILAGKEMVLMVETAIALAVAAIPEGLPIVTTIALARGMRRMAQKNALINRLSAVETLGTTQIICTDKTGTLTENRMTVVRYRLPDGEIDVTTDGDSVVFEQGEQAIAPEDSASLRRALAVGVLCNNASLDDDGNAVGDPLEVALLRVAQRVGIDKEDEEAARPRVREEAFDATVRMMATFHESGEGVEVAVKGAAEAVLDACTRVMGVEGDEAIDDAGRAKWRERNTQLAREGLRVLALADGQVEDADVPPYENLRLLGLVGLMDPPRQDVRTAIERCRSAGMRVVMVTGDQAGTARQIAREVGILREDEDDAVVHGRDFGAPDDLSDTAREAIRDARILVRVSPKQKLDLVAIHQRAGHVVAMTGDGVNDAPALKKADIGVAMGKRGTDVAREAADMVLVDDAFSSIVSATELGRVIFDNIRKFVVYLMSCNLSEIMVVGLASVVQAPLPILPLQILFLNIVTDVFPALALGMGEGTAAVMERPPRPPDEFIVGRRQWVGIVVFSAYITASVLAGFTLAFWWLKMGASEAVTISFLTLSFGQLVHVFNMREAGSSPLRNDVTRNPYIWGALALCTALVIAAVYLPGLSEVLKLQHPGARGWTLVAVMSLFPLVAGQLTHRWLRSGTHPATSVQ